MLQLSQPAVCLKNTISKWIIPDVMSGTERRVCKVRFLSLQSEELLCTTVSWNKSEHHYKRDARIHKLAHTSPSVGITSEAISLISDEDQREK